MIINTQSQTKNNSSERFLSLIGLKTSNQHYLLHAKDKIDYFSKSNPNPYFHYKRDHVGRGFVSSRGTRSRGIGRGASTITRITNDLNDEFIKVTPTLYKGRRTSNRVRINKEYDSWLKIFWRMGIYAHLQMKHFDGNICNDTHPKILEMLTDKQKSSGRKVHAKTVAKIRDRGRHLYKLTMEHLEKLWFDCGENFAELLNIVYNYNCLNTKGSREMYKQRFKKIEQRRPKKLNSTDRVLYQTENRLFLDKNFEKIRGGFSQLFDLEKETGISITNPKAFIRSHMHDDPLGMIKAI